MEGGYEAMKRIWGEKRRKKEGEGRTGMGVADVSGDIERASPEKSESDPEVGFRDPISQTSSGFGKEYRYERETKEILVGGHGDAGRRRGVWRRV